MLESNKFKLGLFVTFTLLLLMFVIASLGVLDALRAKATLATTFEESVQGLNIGSSVKFRGVPIGKVTDITINMGSTRIDVDMEINLSKVKTESAGGYNKPNIKKEEFYDYINKEIKIGLRCRLELDGITGMKYIEIDFFPETNLQPNKVDMDMAGKPAGVCYIPSTPSMLSGIRGNITEILSKVASVDFKKISDRTIEVLDNVDKTISDPNIKELLNNSNKASAELVKSMRNVNDSFTPERMENLISKVDIAVTSINNLALQFRETMERAKVDKSTEIFREAAGVFVKSNGSFTETLVKLNEAIDAMTELVQYLDKDPSSVIQGKSRKMPPPPPNMPEK